MPPTVDQFDIIRNIGNGAFGEVAAVRKIGGVDNGQLYAMKVMDKRKMSRYTARVSNEWNLLTTLDNPFFVTMAYSFQTNRKLVFVMPLAGGGDMLTRMERGYLEEEDAFFYLCELVEAIGYLHGKHILHRDIKLENILIASDGHLMLSDFGFATHNVTAADAVNEFVGTRHTMAPEIHLGKAYGLTADWWALGITYCDLRDELSVFEGVDNTAYSDNTVKRRPKLPKFFSPKERSFVLKLLVKDPSRRLGIKGVDEVKSHDIFKGVNWDDVLGRKLLPPFVPTTEEVNEFSFFPESPEGKNLPKFEQNIAPLFWEDVDFTAPKLK